MRRSVVVGLGLATGLALGWAAFEHYHRNRIYAGVKAAGVLVGSLTLEEAEARIAAAT